MPNVEAEHRFGRNDVRGAWAHLQLSDGGDEAVRRSSFGFHCTLQLVVRRESFPPEIHRRGTGMGGQSGERQTLADLTGNCWDHADWQLAGFEHRTLLDVGLHRAEELSAFSLIIGP